MTFSDQLEKLGACKESIEWVQDKTIEEAWATCENSQWMFWVLTKTNLDLIDPICDIVEEVLHLVPEDNQLACIWAISAARRRANEDELDAAADAASASRYTAAAAAASAARAASVYVAFVSAADAVSAASATSAADAASSASSASSASAASAAYYAQSAQYAAYYAAYAVYYAFGSDAYSKEEKKQCNILRKYFTIDQVREAFNKLVA